MKGRPMAAIEGANIVHVGTNIWKFTECYRVKKIKRSNLHYQCDKQSSVHVHRGKTHRHLDVQCVGYSSKHLSNISSLKWNDQTTNLHAQIMIVTKDDPGITSNLWV